MRVGLVCPYSFDVAGGVQFHVRDLAECLHERGHEVSILAPSNDESSQPFLTSAGRALPIRYNGSVARLAFGPKARWAVQRWVAEGDFDVVHIHEPMVPSVSILALWEVDGPVVATFHTSLERSRAVQTAAPLVRSSMEKIRGRIAVSQAARATLMATLGNDAVVIPNGVFTERYARASPRPEWTGRPDRPTVAFVGRIDEPRKGLNVLLEAVPAIAEQCPGVQVFVAGFGDVAAAMERLDPAVRDNVTFLGPVTEADKASLLASVDLYVAPHTGGESFGIVLVEAMSAGAPVLASDLPPFRAVLADGEAGVTFPTGDSDALAEQAVALLRSPDLREQLVDRASLWCKRFDWARVTEDVVAVYETVRASTVVHPDSATRPGRREQSPGGASGRTSSWGWWDRLVSGVSS